MIGEFALRNPCLRMELALGRHMTDRFGSLLDGLKDFIFGHRR
jgi:hypothetical protein